MRGYFVKFVATMSAVIESRSGPAPHLPTRCSACDELVRLPGADHRLIKEAIDKHLRDQHGLQSLGIIFHRLGQAGELSPDPWYSSYRTILWETPALLDGRLPLAHQNIPNDSVDILLECCPRGRYADPVPQPIDTVDRLVARERIRTGALGAPRSLFPLRPNSGGGR